jgi:hypothetical protein
MKRLFFVIAVMGFISVSAQTDTSYWSTGLAGTFTFNQTSLTNWQAGGESSLGANFLIVLNANYARDQWKWDNRLELAYGSNRQGGRFIKTDDRFEFVSTVGLRVKPEGHWYYSCQLQFKTQFFDGFSAPDDTEIISTFLAPAYTTGGLGMEYKKTDQLTLYISPLSVKHTLVMDDYLSSLGAFGVSPGENSWVQLGAFINVVYVKENLVKNVNFRNKLDLYSNYLNNPQNLDVNWEMIFILKVNSWLSANLQTHLIYDDDITITEVDSDGNVIGEGPRVQFKQIFGAGISVTL